MKKQLLIAAVAATMTASAFADISIKGDARYRFANIDSDSTTNFVDDAGNKSTYRTRFHITGKAGDTTVNATLRMQPNGSATAITNDSIMNITTKIGPVNALIGDYTSKTGLGKRKFADVTGKAKLWVNAADWKIGTTIAAANESGSGSIWVAGKVAGVGVKIKSNDESEWINYAAFGKAGDFDYAAEYHNDETVTDNDTTYLELSTKIGGTKVMIASLENDAQNTSADAEGNFMGTSILNSNTATVIKLGSIHKAVAVSASMPIAGNNVQVTAGRIQDQNASTVFDKNTFYDIKATRDLVSGVQMVVSYGDVEVQGEEASVFGTEVHVKF